MYFRILFVVLILFEGSRGVHARTTEDVINDFEPVFQEIHGEFTKYENLTRVEVEPLFNNVTVAIYNENTNLNITLINTRQEIVEKVWEILEDAGITNHLELIPHCFSNLNKSENTLIATALGGQRICVKLALDRVNSTSIFVQTLITELHNEHEILEVTREECGKLTLPFDVQTCLINDLYLFYPDYLKDVTKEIETRIDIVRPNLKNTIEELDVCDGFLKEGIKLDVDNLLNEFRVCVDEAKPLF